jgi:hypothetical protein
MAKVPTADEIASSFLERPMPIIGKPTRALLIPLREIVHANASQIQTTLGGGLYGYLGAMLHPDVYIELEEAAEFEVPEHPGNVLADELAGTQYAIADALRANKEKLRQYNEYNAVMQALRKQIIDTVEEKYIMSLRNKYTRYNSVHPKDLLKYLFETYGKITPEDVIKNEKKFTESWDGDEAFEVIIERINNCIEFAIEAESPYSEKQIMNHALTIVAKTGLYADDLKIWKKLPANEHTWKKFQEFMLAAQTEFKQQQATNKQMGYGFQAAKMEVAAELMAAAAANSNNNTITMQEFMAMFNAKFETLENTMNAKLALICQPVGERPVPKRPPRPFDNSTYCWTHGYRVSATHNSKTCTRRATGHQEEATRNNNMGGSQVGKPNP